MSRLSVGMFVTFTGAVIGDVVQGLNAPTVVIDRVRLTGVPSAERVVVASAIGVVGIWLVVAVGVFLWHLWKYHHHKGVDPVWRTDALMTSNGLIFELVRRRGSVPIPISDLGHMECRIKTPTGALLRVPDQQIQVRSAVHLQVTLDNPNGLPGVYEVWWYGSKGRWWYEITRATFDLAPTGQWVRNGLESRAA